MTANSVPAKFLTEPSRVRADTTTLFVLAGLVASVPPVS